MVSRGKLARACLASVLLLVALLAACGAQRTDDTLGASGPDASVSSATDHYAFRADGAGGWAAQNLAHAFAVKLDRSALTLTPTTSAPSWSWSMHLAGLGRAGATHAAPNAAPTFQGSRVSYARGAGWTEWYVNGAGGLEQGFDLLTRPGGEGTLAIELDTTGLDPVLSADGTTVRLRDAQGTLALSYGELHAHDARGVALASTISIARGRVTLAIDDARAEYPIVVDPIVWAQQAKVVALDSTADGRFGESVGVSADTAILGAINKEAAYVFVRSGIAWTQQQKLTASDPTSTDLFGGSVAISGNTAVVGASNKSSNTGAAYVFVRSGTVWTQQQKLTASDAAASDQFGVSVSISGDTIVVGASGKATRTGAMYVFVRSGTVWSEQQKLTASDGATEDRFACSVSVSGNTAIGGAFNKATATGAAYVYVRSGTVWTQQQKLTASDAATNSYFGTSVAVDVDTAVVGATQTGNKGGAYAYLRSGTVWTQQQKLVASDGATDDFYGSSVSIAGNSALVGASGKTTNRGAAYVVDRVGTVWTEKSKLLATDGATGDKLGISASLSGNTAFVGASYKNSATGAGYAFALLSATGDGCSAGATCQTGICVDGVCCDKACGGLCEACSAAKKGGGANGTCAPINDGLDPDVECPGMTCPVGTAIQQDGHVCNGAGACRTTTTTPCTPRVCDAAGAACLAASCTSDADCAATHFCSNLLCALKKDKGAQCAATTNCKPGLFCVDGVCCDKACSGKCEACSAAKTGIPGSDGTCGFVVDGKDPDTECVGASCNAGTLAKEACDGKGECRATTTPCGFACESATKCRETCTEDAHCLAGHVCTDGKCVERVVSQCTADRTGSTDVAGVTTPCGAYVCNPTTGLCPTVCESDGDCAVDNVCSSSRTCGPQVAATDDSGGCAVHGTKSGGRAPWLAVLAGLLLAARRARRKERAASRRHVLGGTVLFLVAVVALVASGCGTHGSVSSAPDAPDASLATAGGYDFAPAASSDGARIAHNATQGFTVSLSAREVSIAPASRTGDWTWSMHLARIGRTGTMRDVSTVAPLLAGNRATFTHAGVSEWYLHASAGLEQGFDVGDRSPGEGELAIELDSAGLSPEMTTDGKTLALRDARGAPVLHYGELHAHDARGADVPARLALAGNRIVLLVDDARATYPLAIDPLVWAQQGKLQALDAAGGDELGRSVAISGDTAIVGTYLKNSSAGAAYVFVRSGTTWTQQQKLVGSDTVANDFFGWSVAIQGDTVVVGAAKAGAAYVFTRAGTVWTQQQKLTPSDAAGRFGGSVGVSGDTAVVGAYLSNTSAGAAYVFVRSGTVWSQQQKLLPLDPAANNIFGYSAAASGDTVIIGSWGNASNTGAAYVFARSGTTWTQQQKLGASDAAAGDALGQSVALDGNTAVVGASGKATYTGAAYVYTRSGTVWSEQTKLSASDPATSSYFGASVGISTDTAVVGAYQNSNYAGGAYVFVRAGTAWSFKTKLVPLDQVGGVSTGDHLGFSAAISGDTAAFGAYGKSSPTGDVSAGAAYVFTFRGTNGDACAAGNNCQSGFCADGVCCDQACNGVCVACTSAKKGSGANGVCGAIADNTDPDIECPGVTCAIGTAIQENGHRCNGAGACRVTTTKACAPYVCDSAGGACVSACTKDSDCAASQYCLASTCTPKKIPGTKCGALNECASGFCVDAVCCDAACSGLCQSCLGSRTGVAGSDGTCGPVADATDPDNDCGGPTCTAGTLAKSVCDGKSGCRAETTSCGFACETGSKCRTTCTEDAHCLPGHRCANGTCVETTLAVCTDDRSASIGTTGESTPCGAYTCDPSTGLCASVCASNNDCSLTNVCSSAQTCGPAAAPSGDDSGGCAFAGPSRTNDDAGFVLAGLVGIALFSRRRRKAEIRYPR